MISKKISVILNGDKVSTNAKDFPPLASSPSDSVDLDLHKYAIRNGFKMEKGVFVSSSDDYVIELSDKSRNKEIAEMMVNNFLQDETLVKSLRVNVKLTKSEEADLKADEILLMNTVIESGIVLIAVHKETRRISGAIVLIIRDVEEEKKSEGSNDKKSPKPSKDLLRSRVIKSFYDYMEEIERNTEVNISDKYPNCKLYADVELIGVNKSDRRKGLALDLYKAGIKFVKDIPEVSVLSGYYTSIYSKKIAKKIGKVTLSNFDVMGLKDELGNPVFQDTEPHNIISLMAMEI